MNAYGPTEATVKTTSYWCSLDDEMLPIGKPIANTKVYILDPQNNLTPVGVPGELCTAGIQVAKGYLNRPELTEKKFVPNPFSTNANDKTLYRTGDLVRWLPDGNLEFLGRIDNQVKVRGFRIELGEIESQLIKHPWVDQCTVIVREEEEGNKYICLLYTSPSPRDA